MKTTTKRLASCFVVVSLLLTAGCGRNPDGTVDGEAQEDVAALDLQQNATASVERKLIKQGQVEFETDDVNATRKVVVAAAAKYEGYVSADEAYNSPERKHNTVTVRVPADRFDDLLAEATRGVEKFETRQITVQDVTEAFLDVQARLKTQKELEARYLELLKRAENVTEILAIEQQVGQLRSDIESMEGRLKYLQDNVSFSTLTITFYERVPNQIAFGHTFSSGFRNGWNNLIWFFVALTNVWPFVLAGLGLIIGIRFYKRKR